MARTASARRQAHDDLVSALDSSFPLVRIRAAEALLWHAYEVDRAVEVATRELESGDLERRVRALGVLALDSTEPLRRQDARESLLELARDPTSPGRLVAMESLARGGVPLEPAMRLERVLLSHAETSPVAFRALWHLDDWHEETQHALGDLWRTERANPLVTMLVARRLESDPGAMAAARKALVGVVDTVTAELRGEVIVALESWVPGDKAPAFGSSSSPLSGRVAERARVASAHASLRHERRSQRGLAALDWIVIAAYAVALLAIGLFYARRNRSAEQYWLGGRRLGSTSVGLSLFASLLSTISFLAWPGEMILHGPLYLGLVFGLVPVAFIANRLIIPAIVRLPITSAYELLERVDGSVRTLGSVFFLSLRLIWMAVIIYATSSRVLVPILGLSPAATPLVCVALGGITIVYTSLGGLRAVVMTDVVQTAILFFGALLSLVLISIDLGGVGAWWPTSWASHWPEPVYGYDASARMTLFGMALATFSWHVCTAASDQIAIQRYLSTRDARSAGRALTTSLVADGLVACLLGLLGLALLAYFRAHPHRVPDGPGILSQADQLLPRFISIGLPVGISGLVISGLLAAAMSSLSSGVNSTCSVIATDFVDRFRRERLDDRRRVSLAQWLSAVVGIAVVALATVVGLVPGNLLEVAFKTVNVLVAPLAGLFFLAIFVPWTTAPGAWTGALASLAVVVAINYWEPITGRQGISFIWSLPLGLVTELVVGMLVSCAGRRRPRRLDEPLEGRSTTPSNDPSKA